MATIVGILTLIGRINTLCGLSETEKVVFLGVCFYIYEQFKLSCACFFKTSNQKT